VKPDAVFTYAFGEQKVSGLVEVDMGTERGGRFDRWEQKLTATAPCFAEETRAGVQSLVGTSEPVSW
jgi:hypothetical protein